MPLHKPCRSWRKPQLDWRGCRDDHDFATDCASPGFVPVAGNRGPVPLLAFRFDETVARPTLECIGNSDALYHDIEHTMLVALVGHDILGRTLQRTTTADDYANFILASLTHDIGYVRGIVQGDGDDAYVADLKGRKVQLPVGSSDAASRLTMSIAQSCS